MYKIILTCLLLCGCIPTSDTPKQPTSQRFEITKIEVPESANYDMAGMYLIKDTKTEKEYLVVLSTSGRTGIGILELDHHNNDKM